MIMLAVSTMFHEGCSEGKKEEPSYHCSTCIKSEMCD